MHLSGSIQSLREAVHRIPKPSLSSSRTSLNSEAKVKGDSSEKPTTSSTQDQASVTSSDQQSKSSK